MRRANVDRAKVIELCNLDFTLKVYIRPIVDYLVRQGYDVTAVCSPGPLLHDLEARGYRIIPVRLSRRIRPWANLRSVAVLVRVFRREGVELLHCHNTMASLEARLAAWLSRVPVVIYTNHGFAFHEGSHAIVRRLYIAVERLAGLVTDHIFVQSREDYDTALAIKLVPAHKLTWIGNGIDLAFFHPSQVIEEVRRDLRRQLRLDDDDQVVGIVGRMEQHKGHLDLFQAAAMLRQRFPHLRVLVVGGHGPHRGMYEARVREFGLHDIVCFTGYRSDIRDLMAIMDVFALPSRFEGLPRSIIEAMAMAKPIVATNIRGSREEVLDGETGFLVPVGDIPALAAALERLLVDPDLAARMGNASRRRAEQEYDEELVFERMRPVFQKLISAKLVHDQAAFSEMRGCDQQHPPAR